MRTMTYSVIAAIAVFICGVTLTGVAAAVMANMRYFGIGPIHSVIAIDLLAWGAPAFIASAIAKNVRPTYAKIQISIAAIITIILIAITTPYHSYQSPYLIAALTTSPLSSIVFLPYFVVCLASTLGFYTGATRLTPN